LQQQSFIDGVYNLSSINEVFDLMYKKLGLIKFEPRSLNFTSFCRIIIGQQLSSKAAETIFNRFTSFFSEELSPHTLLNSHDRDMRSLGISRAKTRYIKNLGEKLKNNPCFLTDLKILPSEKIYKILIGIDGVGPWTANIIQLFYLGNLDIFPYGDRSLEKVYSKLYKTSLNSSNPISYEHLKWASPHRGILAVYLWKYLDSGLVK